MRLETERLTLRPLSLDDLDELARFLTDRETMRHIGGGGTRTRDQARETLGRMIQSFDARGYGQLAVERKEDGAFLGRCGLLVWDPETWTITEKADGPLEVEVGYLLGREHWGNGYATEAVGAMVEYGFGELGLLRVQANVYAPNIASARVLEKNGFVLEGVLRSAVRKRGEVLDVRLYARVK